MGWTFFKSDGSVLTSLGTVTSVGTIVTGVWQGTAIASGYIAADAITGAKIADDAVDSEHYTDGSIDTAHIADNQVTLAKMAGITRGSIIYGDSSGDPAALAKGTADYVLTSDGTDIAWAAAASVYTGTYTGDGATSLAITGVGFTTKYIKIWASTGTDDTQTDSIETTTQMIDNNGSGMAWQHLSGSANPVMRVNRIIAIGSDGFTVDDAGDDAHPNKASQAYDFLCVG